MLDVETLQYLALFSLAMVIFPGGGKGGWVRYIYTPLPVTIENKQFEAATLCLTYEKYCVKVLFTFNFQEKFTNKCSIADI